MENNTSAQGVAEILQQEEVRRVTVSAARATYAQAWIAFAAVLITLAGIAVGLIVGYTQLHDNATTTARDTGELKVEVRELSATVNLMAGRMGVQPHRGSNLDGVAFELPEYMPQGS